EEPENLDWPGDMAAPLVRKAANRSLCLCPTRDSAPLPRAAPVAICYLFAFCRFITGKEPPMGARRIRREQRRFDMATSRIVNGHKKKKERVRRDLRMIELVKNNKMPYTPTV